LTLSADVAAMQDEHPALFSFPTRLCRISQGKRLVIDAAAGRASRPADERYTSLYSMREYDPASGAFPGYRRKHACSTVTPDESDPQHRGLFLGVERGPLAGQLLAPTHQAFGQVCSLAATPSPASYFRESRLLAPIIADALNHNLRFTRDVEDVGVLAAGFMDLASAPYTRWLGEIQPRRS
jgi:hypothetical protein